MKIKFFQLFLIIFVFIISFIIGYNVFALEFDVIQSDNDTNFLRSVTGQNFIPSSSNISGISIFNSCAGTSTLDFWICEGDVINDSDVWPSRGCAGDIMIGTNSCTISPSGEGWTDCYLDYSYSISSGNNHYLIIENNTCGTGIRADSGNPYSNGELFGANGSGVDEFFGSGYDMTFRTFYDSDYQGEFDYLTNTEYINDYSTYSAYYAGNRIFSVPNPKNCTNDVDCYLPMSWDEQIDNWIVYGFYQSDNLDWGNEWASTTLDQLPREKGLLLPASTTIEYEIKLLVDNGSKTDGIILGPIHVIWGDATSTLSSFLQYNIESACNDVATSTGGMADDFRYSLECSFRKVLYWAFTPKLNTIQTWKDTKDLLFSQFPMSVVNQLFLMVTDIDEYSTTTPEIDLQYVLPDDMPGRDEMIILSEDIIDDTANKFGLVWTTISELVQRFIYLLVAFYVIIRFWRMAKSNENSE